RRVGDALDAHLGVARDLLDGAPEILVPTAVAGTGRRIARDGGEREHREPRQAAGARCASTTGLLTVCAWGRAPRHAPHRCLQRRVGPRAVGARAPPAGGGASRAAPARRVPPTGG